MKTFLEWDDGGRLGRLDLNPREGGCYHWANQIPYKGHLLNLIGMDTVNDKILNKELGKQLAGEPYDLDKAEKVSCFCHQIQNN